MARNLTEQFQNLDETSDTLVDRFIDQIQIRLTGCGIYEGHAVKINSFLFPAFFAVYYKTGTVEIQHRSETTILKPGSFYLFRPYDIYNGRRIGEAPLCFCYLQFDVTPFMERYNFGTITLASSDTIFQDARYRDFGRMLEVLAHDAPDRGGRSALLRQLVKLIMAQLVYDSAESDSTSGILKRGRESALINNAFRYTAAHLSDPIVINHILTDGKTSKTTLERAFRSVLDTTPQRALLRFKIERSMEMLQQNISLNTTAAALGFSSVYHFSNAFRNITGMRPTEYRKQLISGHGSKEHPA